MIIHNIKAQGICQFAPRTSLIIWYRSILIDKHYTHLIWRKAMIMVISRMMMKRLKKHKNKKLPEQRRRELFWWIWQALVASLRGVQVIICGWKGDILRVETAARWWHNRRNVGEGIVMGKIQAAIDRSEERRQAEVKEGAVSPPRKPSLKMTSSYSSTYDGTGAWRRF